MAFGSESPGPAEQVLRGLAAREQHPVQLHALRPGVRTDTRKAAMICSVRVPAVRIEYWVRRVRSGPSDGYPGVD